MSQQPTSERQTQQAFDQYVPESVSRAVYQLEQLATDAEWAHGQAMRSGDPGAASTLADVTQIADLQKDLLLRDSDIAQTMGQSTQQAFRQCSQQLRQSDTPGARHVAQLLQQTAQSITQAGSGLTQSKQVQGPTGHSPPGGQASGSSGGGQRF